MLVRGSAAGWTHVFQRLLPTSVPERAACPARATEQPHPQETGCNLSLSVWKVYASSWCGLLRRKGKIEVLDAARRPQVPETVLTQGP